MLDHYSEEAGATRKSMLHLRYTSFDPEASIHYLRKAGVILIIVSILFASLSLPNTAYAATSNNPSNSAESSTSPHATSISEITLPAGTVDPWGLTQDNRGNLWVAVPLCDPTPVCSKTLKGAIIQVDKATFTAVNIYQEPDGFSSPVFLEADADGNIWFTQPTTNAIGKLTPNVKAPGSSEWDQWNPPTAHAAPYDLAFDKHGRLWFTEMVANKIGSFDPNNKTFTETPTPSAGSKPYGISHPDPVSGTMWFTENSAAVAQIASFTPPASGSLNSGDIKEYLTNAIAIGSAIKTTPHLITLDNRGSVWWTGGEDGRIGRLIIDQAVPGTSRGVSNYREPQADPNCPNAPNCNIHTSGIAADSNGKIWFDDSQNARVMSFDPATGAFTAHVLGGSINSNAHPHDGLLADGTAIYFSQEYLNKLGWLLQNGTPARPDPGPSNKSWYFAEGRVGKGFREFLLIHNPGTTDCTVDVNYYSIDDGSPTPHTQKVTATVKAGTRMTRWVHNDLNIDWADTNKAASVAAKLTVTNPSGCSGVVAERSQYVSNYVGISSGTDAMGSTKLSKNWYFADVASDQNNTTFLSILNPQDNNARVTVDYYSDGQKVESQSSTFPGNARGTFVLGAIKLPRHVAAVVTSDQSILVERPTYFSNINGTSGAANVVGASALANSWYFAEGYTRNMQEDLVIANLDPANKSAQVTVTLRSTSGATKTFPVTVAANSQLRWNVSANNTFEDSTSDVSAEVQSSGAKVVVQRQMFFNYAHTLGGRSVQANGGTDTIGLAGPARSSYSFAEGYTAAGYNTWLTLLNPGASGQTVYLTLSNSQGKSLQRSFFVGANSRYTVDVTSLMVSHLIGQDAQSYELSMTVQTLNGAPFVAERVMYWNTADTGFVTQGGSVAVGYIGG